VTTPFQGQFVIHRWDCCDQPSHQTSVSMFTHCRDMKGNTECRNWVFWGF